MKRALVVCLLVILTGCAGTTKETGVGDVIELKGGVRIETLGPFVFGGCPQWGCPDTGACPSMSWDRLAEIKKKHGLKSGSAEYGVCVLPPKPDPKQNYYYAASILFDRVEDVPDELFIKIVPRQRFAVFTAEENTTEKLIRLWGKSRRWLKASGYRRANSSVNIEKYSRAATEKHEIWVAVVPKQPAAREGGKMLRIETKRLVLRPFAADDWQDFRELALDWEAAPGPAFDKWRTSEAACKGSVQHMSTRGNYFAMCLRESGKVVGLLAINGIDENRQLDLGHVILSKYQDNDHDREALEALIQHCFDERGAVSVITRNAPDHAAQLAPLKSLGFTNKNPENRGELVIAKDAWEQRR